MTGAATAALLLTAGNNPDRLANAALHRIVIVRLRWQARTRAYQRSRTTEGRTPQETVHCLKRYVAREIYHALPRAALPITSANAVMARPNNGLLGLMSPVAGLVAALRCPRITISSFCKAAAQGAEQLTSRAFHLRGGFIFFDPISDTLPRTPIRGHGFVTAAFLGLAPAELKTGRH
ncbi:hypothetical protein [Protofrankia symbiont of Coriaria ruscifolia]|uniref:hypothetical protein n=1 Tax=Protofrankia symbiont of Coriaria ruscifolia TaxID=1306542 RepID=UPI001041A9ED|nr:hypothetical protein [Protofrankia symbiont of Coriaria ruscifolia]